MSPFEKVIKDSLLSQGDIIADCPVYLHPDDTSDRSVADPKRHLERVIVLTQACDLAQVKTGRVIVALVHAADVLIEAGYIKASVVRDQVRRGHVFGWYYLPADDAIGLPESLVDLRNLHTIPRPLLEQLTQAGNRVARLVTPFREHLAQHFAVTYMRIALPEPYDIKA
jgi:hypothetical protein